MWKRQKIEKVLRRRLATGGMMLAPGRLRVKNWREFQHYQNKSAPVHWIKLHKRLLSNVEFRALTPTQRYALVAIWLLASERGGEIPHDKTLVGHLIGVARLDLDFFVRGGWLENVVVEPEGDEPF